MLKIYEKLTENLNFLCTKGKKGEKMTMPGQSKIWNDAGETKISKKFPNHVSET